MRQKFKGKTLYTKRVVRNILSVFSLVDDPTDWYQDAHDYAVELSQESGYQVEKTAGVIAALSPRKSWPRNKEIARSFIRGGSSYHTKILTQKAQDILDSSGDEAEICDILNGNKITAFFLNILHPRTSTSVTIDRHALSVALGRTLKDSEMTGITAPQYQFFERCYRIAAERAQTTPLQMQSAVWEKWKELKKETDQAPHS